MLRSNRRTNRSMRGNTRRNVPRRPPNYKSLTANAPFRIRSPVIPHIPSHSEGLTMTRVIRLSNRAVAVGGTVTHTYQSIFDRFLAELGITAVTGLLSFNPRSIKWFVVSDVINSVNCRAFDEPRSGPTVNTFTNGVYFEATDSAPISGVCDIRAVIPKAASYTINNGDPAVLKALPFVTVIVESVSDVYVDVEATFTIKVAAGINSYPFPHLLQRLSLQDAATTI